MKYYTGVGSRKTPPYIQQIMSSLASKLEQQGWVLRSGGAKGADTAFESGVRDVGRMEIYTAPLVGWYRESKHYHISLPMPEDSMKIASSLHPAWDRCTPNAKLLHARNIHQVLGRDLETPSRFLVCFAHPDGDSVVGGTRTAWECAKRNNVPVFNLYCAKDMERIQAFLK